MSYNQPLSCVSGEGGAQRRVRAPLLATTGHNLTPTPLPRRRRGAKAGGNSSRWLRDQPLSCAAGEGGAQRRVRARLFAEPDTPSPQPLSRFAGEGLKRAGILHDGYAHSPPPAQREREASSAGGGAGFSRQTEPPPPQPPLPLAGQGHRIG